MSDKAEAAGRIRDRIRLSPPPRSYAGVDRPFNDWMWPAGHSENDESSACRSNYQEKSKRRALRGIQVSPLTITKV